MRYGATKAELLESAGKVETYARKLRADARRAEKAGDPRDAADARLCAEGHEKNAAQMRAQASRR